MNVNKTVNNLVMCPMYFSYLMKEVNLA